MELTIYYRRFAYMTQHLLNNPKVAGNIAHKDEIKLLEIFFTFPPKLNQSIAFNFQQNLMSRPRNNEIMNRGFQYPTKVL